MKKILLLLSVLVLSITINAQTLSELFNNLNKEKTGYKISGEVIGLQDSSVILAYYFGGKQYATDTAEVINGKFTFEGKKDLKGGMYLMVLSESNYFDIIISEQYFSFSTKLDDLVGSMTFKNSTENPPFYEYLNFITQMQKDVTPLRQQLENAEGDAKKELQEKVSKIDTKVKKYRDDFIKENNDCIIYTSNAILASHAAILSGFKVINLYHGLMGAISPNTYPEYHSIYVYSEDEREYLLNSGIESEVCVYPYECITNKSDL